MKQLEDKNILSDDIYAAIRLIVTNRPATVFGGSIALNAVGVIHRPISDIDLFFPLCSSMSKTGFLSFSDMAEFISDTVTNTNGKEIQRTGAKVLGVKTCCFKVDDEELSHSKYTFNRDGEETTICIQNVNYAIEAKRAYSSRNIKHKIDLDNIDKELSLLLI